MITQRLSTDTTDGNFSIIAEVHEANDFSFEVAITIKQARDPEIQTVEWVKRVWAMAIELVDTEIERQEALFVEDESEGAK